MDLQSIGLLTCHTDEVLSRAVPAVLRPEQGGKADAGGIGEQVGSVLEPAGDGGRMGDQSHAQAAKAVEGLGLQNIEAAANMGWHWEPRSDAKVRVQESGVKKVDS
jgi:hypothetical protein